MRILVAIMVLLAALSPLAADTNDQKVYTVRDSIYYTVEALCREAGVVGPQSVSPMTARALLIALERIDPEDLSASAYREYTEVMEELKSPDALFNENGFGANINLEANLGFSVAPFGKMDYSHRIDITADSDPAELNEQLDRNRDIESLMPYRYQDPMLTIGADFFFGDNVYLEGEISIGNNNHHMYWSTFAWLFDYYDGMFYTPGVADVDNVSFMAREFPQRAGLAAGNDNVSFIIGRYPHSMGSGVTGNMMIGDNFIYQDVMLFSFMSRSFTYNISVTHFDSMMSPWEHTDTSDAFVYNPYQWWVEMNPQKFKGPQQYRIAHRFDITPIDQLRIVINLATLYETTFGLDIRFFEPFMFHHNLFNYTNTPEEVFYDEANNIMSFEVEGALGAGFSVSGQFVVDQITLGIEKGGLPSAYGILANVKHTARVGNGRLDSWLEFVYSSPYLYLNGKYTDENGNRVYNHNLDHVVGYSTWANADYGYTGYLYGPDNITVSLGTKYGEDTFEVGGNLMYKAQGQNGVRHTSPWNRVTYIDMSHGVFPEDGVYAPTAPSGPADRIEHMFKVAVYGKMFFTYENLELYGAIGMNMYWNYNNKPGQDMFLPQASVGVKWTGLNNDWF